MLKRILAGGLTAAMTFSLLTGCDAPALNSSSSDTYQPTIPAAAQEDVDSYLTGGASPAATPAMTINGTAVPRQRLLLLDVLLGRLPRVLLPEQWRQ